VSKPRTRVWREWRKGLDIKNDGRRFGKDGDRPSGQDRISHAIQQRIERNRQPVQEEPFL
jgi:hypothetical protein